MILDEDYISYIFRQIRDCRDHVRLSQINKTFNKISYDWIYMIPYSICEMLIKKNMFVDIVSRYVICDELCFPYKNITDASIKFLCNRYERDYIHAVHSQKCYNKNKKHWEQRGNWVKCGLHWYAQGGNDYVSLAVIRGERIAHTICVGTGYPYYTYTTINRSLISLLMDHQHQ